MMEVLTPEMVEILLAKLSQVMNVMEVLVHAISFEVMGLLIQVRLEMMEG